ncbi:hypothetical protein GQ55_7G177100 [Panicum hallii var. hallii]|uniref:Uncharacterized protein n=1 Tax=Panicum hallii var. hallii TaxID=1504633 RepID=A0A2T7CW65_9POAL|nr:hypothetical protein GQ55_7G177100 [Panicum hallii var. hallii]
MPCHPLSSRCAPPSIARVYPLSWPHHALLVLRLCLFIARQSFVQLEKRGRQPCVAGQSIQPAAIRFLSRRKGGKAPRHPHPLSLAHRPALPGCLGCSFTSKATPSPYRRGDRATHLPPPLPPIRSRVRGFASTTRGRERESPEAVHQATCRGDAMCKLKFTRERVGCYLLVILVIVLIIGVLFGLGVFRHGVDRIRDLGRNHTCFDCNRY